MRGRKLILVLAMVLVFVFTLAVMLAIAIATALEVVIARHPDEINRCPQALYLTQCLDHFLACPGGTCGKVAAELQPV